MHLHVIRGLATDSVYVFLIIGEYYPILHVPLSVTGLPFHRLTRASFISY